MYSILNIDTNSYFDFESEQFVKRLYSSCLLPTKRRAEKLYNQLFKDCDSERIVEIDIIKVEKGNIILYATTCND